MSKSQDRGVGLCSRDQILGAVERRFKDFPVEGLPGNVRIRSLTEREKSEYEATFLDKKGELSRDKLRTARRRLVILTVVDATGNPLLTEADLDALEGIDGNITSAIQAQAQVHCGIGAAQLEEARKN